MATCCQGPASATISYTPCGGGAALSAVGFVGMHQRKTGEHCGYMETIFSSRAWQHEVPAAGSTVSVSGDTWYVDESQYAAPCNLVLKLCKPLMDCPDALSSVYRLARGTKDENCLVPLEGTEIAANVPTTVCVTEKATRNVNGAIIHVKRARLCLDTVVDLLPGDFVYVAPDSWRVTSIVSSCSARCLYTIMAELDPFGVFAPPD